MSESPAPPPAPARTRTTLRALAVALALGLAHLGLGALLGGVLSPTTNAVFYAANLYVLYAAQLVARRGSPGRVGLFALGYFVLFALVMVLLERQALFILLAVFYASVFSVPYLLGFFALFVLSFVVLQPYGTEVFIPAALGYALLVRAHRAGASRFLLGCFAAGLGFLLLVLFPLVHLAIQDSPRTFGQLLDRSDVRSALLVSLSSATVATFVVALFGIPLAYALARLPFRGRRLVETLVDLPILVPQSVVGIALLSLLGPGSPAGAFLEDRLGLAVAGRFSGLVLAQVFVSCPFLIKTACTAFHGVPTELESAARTLGASPAVTFRRVTLPLASRGLLTGAALSWARAVSEFGAIVLFASSPLTAPVLVHTEFMKAGVSESRPIATLLLLVCLWVFVLLQFGQAVLPLALRRDPVSREGSP
ncbi:MAG: ABC transporter permease [Deltaproteobacteria bacterium]|nr:ABC transporter permease [Deltaproteobacteria bacterium]